MVIEERIFDYHGLPVHFKVFGKGKPILFLHGWGASSEVMLPLASSMKSKRTYYLIDFPGFGKSPAPSTAWDVGQYADMIAAFIVSIGHTGPVDILAHSFGGRVTLKLCANGAHSALVDKVIITGGAGMTPNRPFSYYLKKYLAKLLKLPFTLLPEKYSGPGLVWLRSSWIWRALGSPDYKSLNGVMRETFVKTVSEFLEPVLPMIDHEVLLLWGSNDDSTPLYQAKIMERGIRNAGLAVIDQAGHYAFLDKPHQFRIITETFLNQ